MSITAQKYRAINQLQLFRLVLVIIVILIVHAVNLVLKIRKALLNVGHYGSYVVQLLVDLREILRDIRQHVENTVDDFVISVQTLKLFTFT